MAIKKARKQKNPLKYDAFYHYTCKQHLSTILSTLYLKRTCSNLSMKHQHTSPVVWLTSELEVGGLGLEHNQADKTEIRVTVAPCRHYHDWLSWSRAKSIQKVWAYSLEKGKNPKSWWISEKEIPKKDILKIENRYTGEVYYKKGDILGTFC